jgi:predicted regulator of Ras-like GTPase activity (Roadblock/LC7/MglB family)
MNYGIDQDRLIEIDSILREDLIEIGVDYVLMIDTAGNTIAKCDSGAHSYDVASLAALAAGNYATVDAMAKIVGEQEFSLLFHKGENVSIHFSMINEEFLLIILFGKEVSLGFLRLKVAEAIDKVRALWK